MNNLIIQFDDVKLEIPLASLRLMAEAKATPVPAPAPKPALAPKPAMLLQPPAMKLLVESAPIEQAVPLKRNLVFGRALSKKISKLKRGESFFVPSPDPKKVRWSASSCASHLRATGRRLRITTKQVFENGQPGLRIWRAV